MLIYKVGDTLTTHETTIEIKDKDNKVIKKELPKSINASNINKFNEITEKLDTHTWAYDSKTQNIIFTKIPKSKIYITVESKKEQLKKKLEDGTITNDEIKEALKLLL